MPGTATFRPEPSDYVAVSRGSFVRGLYRRRFRIRLGLALAIGAAIGAGVSAIDTGTPQVGMTILGAGAMLCWLLVLLTGLYALLPRRTRRLFRQQRSLLHDFEMAWDEHGLRQQWNDGALTTRWTEYHDWFENRSMFAFGLNERLYHFVPKRVLTQEAQIDLRACANGIDTHGGAS